MKPQKRSKANFRKSPASRTSPSTKYPPGQTPYKEQGPLTLEHLSRQPPLPPRPKDRIWPLANEQNVEEKVRRMILDD